MYYLSLTLQSHSLSTFDFKNVLCNTRGVLVFNMKLRQKFPSWSWNVYKLAVHLKKSPLINCPKPSWALCSYHLQIPWQSQCKSTKAACNNCTTEATYYVRNYSCTNLRFPQSHLISKLYIAMVTNYRVAFFMILS